MVETATPPTIATEQGPGVLGTLWEIAKNLKIGFGPQSMIKSGATPGMSYNDLLKPMREAKDQSDTADMFIHVGENMLGMDMAPFKESRERQKAQGQPPSLGFNKALEGIITHGMQYGPRRPIGPAAAEAMFPGQQTVITQPEQDFTPEGAYVPPTVSTTGEPLTGLQQSLKAVIPEMTERDYTQRLLPLLLQHPELLSGIQTGTVKEQRIGDLKRAFPDMTSDTEAMLRNGFTEQQYAHPQSYQQYVLPFLQRRLAEDRTTVRAEEVRVIAERDKYTQQGRTLNLSQEGYAQYVRDLERAQKPAEMQQIYTRYAVQARPQSDFEALKTSQSQALALGNSYANRLTPEQHGQFSARVNAAESATEVQALIQELTRSMPVDPLLTEDQKATRVQRLSGDIMGNLGKLTAYSGWLSGAIPGDQASQALNMPGGTVLIPASLFGPTKPVKPLPTSQAVKSLFGGAFATIERDIQELSKYNPGLAEQHRANLQGLRDDVVRQTGGTPGPPALPGGAATPAAGAGKGSADAQVSKNALKDVLTARGLTEMPSDPAQRKDVLDAYYNLMAGQGYDVKALGAWLQRTFKGWQPPASP